MKNIISFRLYLLVLFGTFSTITFSQTIINYQTWTGASGCNIFASSTNVPATINGVNSTVAHLTAIGQPTYDNVNKSVNLVSEIINGSQNQGTEYRTTVNFKLGYSYKITINAARIMSQQTGANVLLRLDLNNGGSGGNTVCNGTGVIDANGSGNLKKSFQITGTSFADYVFDYNSLSAAQIYLMVAAIPPAASVYQTILIRKITITETAPPISFTITPNPVSVVCGKVNPVTLTVNNVNNTPGVTGYTWNLGAGNTWFYNGSVAPATISTTTNTLILSPTCGIIPTSVTASVSAGINSYPTNTATISSVNETLSITGSSPLCSGSAIYSVLNLPICGATVNNWNATPSGIVQITDNGNNTATISKLADGQVTVTATVNLTNPCNTSTVNLSVPLSTSGTQPSGYYIINSNYNQPIQRPLYTNNSPIWLPPNQSFGVTVYMTNPYINWARAASSFPFSWSSSATQLNFTGTAGSTAYNQRNGTFELTANTGCGVTTTAFTWPVIVQSGGFRIAASPNPVKDNLAVSLFNESTEVKGLSKTETITISLYNLNSTIAIKTWTFKNTQLKFNLNLSDIKHGYYILKVQKGKYQQSEKIIKE